MNEQIQEVAVNIWVQKDFLINLIVGIIGIIVGLFSVGYSYKSFIEAGKAKKAAEKAGKTVRKQDIIVILTEMSNGCKVQENSDYIEMSDKYRLIHTKISNIKGLSNDLNEDQSTYLINIESSLNLVRSNLDLFNTAVSGEKNDYGESALFMYLEPPMTQVAGHIELLKGSLQKSLI